MFAVVRDDHLLHDRGARPVPVSLGREELKTFDMLGRKPRSVILDTEGRIFDDIAPHVYRLACSIRILQAVADPDY